MHSQSSASGLFFFLLVGLALVCLIAPPVTHAQRGDADVLVAEAVLAYDEKDYGKAFDFLHRALQFDPWNARGLYYLGLVRLARQEPEQAITPLETLHSMRPTDLQAQYQLGIAYFSIREYDKARPLFETVYRQQPTWENLGYYVGFLRYRHKDHSQAVEALETNKTTDPNVEQLARFYKGLALGVLGLPDQAIRELATAQQTQAVSPITGLSLRVREALVAGQRVEELKRFRAQLSLGGYYDDNVAINPNPSRDLIAEAFRIRKTTSPGLITSAFADYAFYRGGPLEATATYSFLHTLNFSDGLDAFNLQSHLGGLSGFYRGALGKLPYELSARYTYDYLFLDSAGFMSRHTPTFSATVVPPTFTVPVVGTVGGLTTVLYRYQVKEFYREPANTDFRFGSVVRDAFNNMIGVLHLVRFDNNRYLIRFGYQYDNEAAEGSAFSYTGNRFQTGGQATLPWDMILRYDYEVHWRAYKSPQVLFFDDNGTKSQRYDIEQSHLVQVSKPIAKSLLFTLQYQRIRNDSNIPVYDYTKNVFTGLVTWTY